MQDFESLPPQWVGRKFRGREYAVVVAVVVLLVILTFPKYTLSSAQLFTRPWIDGHASEFAFFPWDQFISRHLSSGEIPFWNPFEAGGNPLVANYQSSLFYPLKFLVYFFGALDTYLLVRLVLAGVFMYRFCRFLRLSRLSAWMGTLVFTLQSYFLLFLNLPHVNAEVFIPLVLFTSAAYIRFGGPWRFLAAAVSVAIVAYGGHPEATFYVLLFTGGYSVFEGWVAGKGGGGIPAVRRILGGPLIHACGVCLGAVQILPFLEYLGQAWHIHAPGVGGVHRDALGFVEFVVPHLRSGHFDFPMGVGCIALMLALGAVIGLRRLRARAVYFTVIPVLFGGLFLGVWPFTELGRLPFIGEAGNIKYPAPIVNASLAVLAAMGLDRLRSRTDGGHPCRGFHFLGAGLLVVGFGIPMVLGILREDLRGKLDTGACALVAAMVVGISVFIHLRQKRVLGPRALPMACLATGLAALWTHHAGIGGKTGWGLAGIVLVGPALAACHARWRGSLPRGRVWIPVCLTLLAVGIVHVVKDRVVDPPGGRRLLPDPEIPPEFVTLILEENAARKAGPFRIAGEPLALPANQATVYGLEDVRSFDALYVDRFFQFLNVINELPDYREVFLPLPPRITQQEALKLLIQSRCDWYFFEQTKRSGIKPEKFTDPLVDLLGVRFFLYYSMDLDRQGPVPIGPDYRVIYDRHGYRVVANDRALPRAFLVHSAERVASAGRAKARLGEATFKACIRDVVILEGRLPGPLPDTGRQTPEETVRVRREGPHHTRVDVEAKQPGVLVLTDNNYPGWEAVRRLEDGREEPVDILPADLAFRGVYLPAGTHQVHFRYRPRSVLYGGALAGAVLVLILGACLLPPIRRLFRRRGGE